MFTGRQVDTIFKDNRNLRGSVNDVMEDINLLDDVTKKAVSVSCAYLS